MTALSLLLPHLDDLFYLGSLIYVAYVVVRYHTHPVPRVIHCKQTQKDLAATNQIGLFVMLFIIVCIAAIMVSHVILSNDSEHNVKILDTLSAIEHVFEGLLFLCISVYIQPPTCIVKNK